MALLLGWPVIQGVLQAFQDGGGFTLDFVNRMVQDPYFWPAVRNTGLLILVMIPLQFGIRHRHGPAAALQPAAA